MDWRKIMNQQMRSYTQNPYNPQNLESEVNITDCADITDKVEKLKLDDPELRYWFEERAAIMEFDGGLSREEAEALARDRLSRE